MILAAQIQFYFDHFLPTDDSWPASFRIDVNGFHVNVEPRRRDDPLFPDAIDRTVSSTELRLTPLSRSGGVSVRRVSDLAVDRLGVTVISRGVPLSGDGLVPPDTEERFIDVGVRVTDLVVSHLRILTDSDFVTGVRREYRADDARFIILTPHTIRWFAGTDPTNLDPFPLYPEGQNGRGTSGALRVPERGSVSFDPFWASMTAAGGEPALSRTLLVSARERITQLALREATILMASACEIASDRYLAANDAETNADVRASLRDRGKSFAERRLHVVTQMLSGRSFKQERPDLFTEVERLYRARSKVAHTGQLVYLENGAPVRVDQSTAVRFLLAANSAVGWLDSCAM